ncbi:MAG: penicillin-binding protein activator, partial [Gammaproteobacteria bacterium]|nr:penicillin-binding protein activator [Gammaproteobacteria bacterium]
RNLLANRLGVTLKFQARRRQDIDCIFVAARAAEARLLKPQINYFRAHDVPVYATSHVYAAQPDPVNDADLNGIVFGDMPWLLLDDRAMRARRDSLPQQVSAYKNTPLDRLYALGMDAYTIVPSLAYLRSNPVSQISGATARLNVTRSGHINRRLTWARFENGLPVVQDTILEDRRSNLDEAGRISPAPESRQVGGT